MTEFKWVCDRCGEDMPDEAESRQWERPTTRATLWVCVPCADEIEQSGDRGRIVA